MEKVLALGLVEELSWGIARASSAGGAARTKAQGKSSVGHSKKPR